MIIKTIHFLYLVCYIAIAAQIIFYLLVLSDVLRLLPLDQFISLRKAIDVIIVPRITFLYYVTLFLNLIILAVNIKTPGSVMFISTAIALVCLVADLTLALKGNVPINAKINGYVSGSTAHNWEALRNTWLLIIFWRGVCLISGVSFLLIGLLGRK